MKKVLTLITFAAFLCGCVGMNTTDGDTTKNWITIDSSKSDVDGKNKDVCYRLKLRFNPSDAMNRLNTDHSCITKCCWYSERKTVDIDLNANLTEELIQNGYAAKYTPEHINITLRYMSWLDAMHATVSPIGAVKSDGLIMLDYSQVKDEQRLVQLELANMPQQIFEEPAIAAKTAYTYRAPEVNPDAELEAAIALQQEQAAKLAQKPAAAVKQAKEVKEVKTQKAAAVKQVKANVPAAKTAAKNIKIEDIDLSAVNTNRLTQKEREELLQKKLNYERAQAVALVKRFYGKDIDAYILSIDRQQRAKGLTLLSNDRRWSTIKTGSPIYRVQCSVAGMLGAAQNSMKPFPIECGVYEVNLDEKTIAPKDTKAISIINGEFR